MPIKQIVVDASPLITLYKSQLANLLPQLFAQVQVPPAVWQEVTAAKDDISAQSLPQSNWATRTEAIALTLLISTSNGVITTTASKSKICPKLRLNPNRQQRKSQPQQHLAPTS